MDFKTFIILRKKEGLSQREMANILDISKSTYGRWETGEEIIPLKHLIKYCQFFKVSMDYVFNLSKKNLYNKYDYNKTINKISIGKNIKYIRKQRGLTQQDLANIFNTSQSTISAYENGKTILLTIFAYHIAKKFNISLDSLCNLEKQKETIMK